ncbi:MAG: tetraacyldisaccharide 4'-kinase [Cyclobacteriaceae bacterium]
MLPVILAPFSWLYGAVTRFRNFLYDNGFKKSDSFDRAVICVGNLSVGGTGKTPMIEYLVRLLSKEYKVAILSRGYDRKTNGFRLAGEQGEDTSTIGENVFQFFNKFKSEVVVAVCESRVEGINRLLEINNSLNVMVLLLDDAFQHRAVKPIFSILLTEFSKPFFNDRILPQGRLRESRAGSIRADVVVVTKCNEINEERISFFEKSIEEYAGGEADFLFGNKLYPTSVI